MRGVTGAWGRRAGLPSSCSGSPSRTPARTECPNQTWFRLTPAGGRATAGRQRVVKGEGVCCWARQASGLRGTGVGRCRRQVQRWCAVRRGSTLWLPFRFAQPPLPPTTDPRPPTHPPTSNSCRVLLNPPKHTSSLTPVELHTQGWRELQGEAPEWAGRAAGRQAHPRPPPTLAARRQRSCCMGEACTGRTGRRLFPTPASHPLRRTQPRLVPTHPPTHLLSDSTTGMPSARSFAGSVRKARAAAGSTASSSSGDRPMPSCSTCLPCRQRRRCNERRAGRGLGAGRQACRQAAPGLQAAARCVPGHRPKLVSFLSSKHRAARHAPWHPQHRACLDSDERLFVDVVKPHAQHHAPAAQLAACTGGAASPSGRGRLRGRGVAPSPLLEGRRASSHVWTGGSRSCPGFPLAEPAQAQHGRACDGTPTPSKK